MKPESSSLRKLERILLNIPVEQDGMLIDELDGFLAGIVVCPDMIMPSEWLPQVWSAGGKDDNTPFEALEEVEEALSLVMGHYNSIASALHKGEGSYEPVYTIDDANGDILWEIWIGGFRRAMELRPDSFVPVVLDGGDAREAFVCLTRLVVAANRIGGLNDDDKKLSGEAPDLIPQCVEQLNAWRLANSTSGPPPRTAPAQGKVGRNAPCPCGSGRKYKKCCLLN